MKCLILIIGLLLLSFESQAQLVDGSDKAYHFGASLALTVVGYTTLRLSGIKPGPSLFIATILTISIGIAKELQDESLDIEDLHYNMLGTAAVVIPIAIFHW